jgi:hypothetical protein
MFIPLSDAVVEKGAATLLWLVDAPMIPQIEMRINSGKSCPSCTSYSIFLPKKQRLVIRRLASSLLQVAGAKVTEKEFGDRMGEAKEA